MMKKKEIRKAEGSDCAVQTGLSARTAAYLKWAEENAPAIMAALQAYAEFAQTPDVAEVLDEYGKRVFEPFGFQYPTSQEQESAVLEYYYLSSRTGKYIYTYIRNDGNQFTCECRTLAGCIRKRNEWLAEINWGGTVMVKKDIMEIIAASLQAFLAEGCCTGIQEKATALHIKDKNGKEFTVTVEDCEGQRLASQAHIAIVMDGCIDDRYISAVFFDEKNAEEYISASSDNRYMDMEIYKVVDAISALETPQVIKTLEHMRVCLNAIAEYKRMVSNGEAFGIYWSDADYIGTAIYQSLADELSALEAVVLNKNASGDRREPSAALERLAVFAIAGLVELDNSSSKVTMFEDICKELNALYDRKNRDYGDAFAKSMEKHGLTMPCIRLTDKLNRFKALAVDRLAQMVDDENLFDTLKDFANYALLTLVELRLRR